MNLPPSSSSSSSSRLPPADMMRRDIAMLRVIGDQNPHSQFPSSPSRGPSRTIKKNGRGTPYMPPASFFQNPVQSGHSMQTRSRNFNSQAFPASTQRGYATEHGQHPNPNQRRVSNNSNNNTSSFPPEPTTQSITVDGVNYNFTSTPAPPKVDHTHKRGPDPRRTVLARPIPAPAYFRSVIRGSQRLPQPRPLLIILDLNGVLVHRRKGSKTGFTPRQDLPKFLEYLFSNHHVMVWSSGMPSNVVKICENVFTPCQFAALIDIWARDTLRLPPSLFAQNVQVYKQLSWVWSHPTLTSRARLTTSLCDGTVGDGYDETNTVLIDDSEEKAVAEPFNLVKVDEFYGQKEKMSKKRKKRGEKGVLGTVADYLEALKWESNVGAFMHKSPFVGGKSTGGGGDGDGDGDGDDDGGGGEDSDVDSME